MMRINSCVCDINYYKLMINTDTHAKIKSNTLE